MAITDESREASPRIGPKRQGTTDAGVGKAGSVKHPQKPEAGLRAEGEGSKLAGLGEEETDSLSYSEIMIEPEVEASEEAMPRPKGARNAERPQSMTYSEIRIGPEKEELYEAGLGLAELGTEKKGEWPTNSGTSPEGADLKDMWAEPEDKEAEEVYYIQLLDEDEVIYDLMYASGHGSIQFWQPQGTLPESATPGDTTPAEEPGKLACMYMLFMLETFVVCFLFSLPLLSP